MKTTDGEKFSELMLALSEYYEKAFTASVMRMYWDDFLPYDIATVTQAFNLHRKGDSGRFMPKSNEIITIIEGSSTEGAALAWTKAEKAIGSPGIYCDVCFDDAIINRVISDIGGWIKFCNSTTDEFPFIENDFKARYKAYRIRGNIEQYPKSLTGITNLNNANGGFALEEVRLFGDQNKALQVHLAGSFDPVYPVLPLSQSLSKDVVKRIEK